MTQTILKNDEKRYFVQEDSTKFYIQLKSLPQSGYIAWEYNPFHNQRLTEDLYEYDGYYYNLAQLADQNIYLNIAIIKREDSYIVSNIKNGEELKDTLNTIKEAFNPGKSQDRAKLIKAINDYCKKAKNVHWIGVPEYKTDPILHESGELVDFITDQLEFDINHPVDIITQNSYDNSVNLIMNDGYSYPKLINSRFSPTGKNTYEIVDRKGTSDTNIYDMGKQFKTDISLYKTIDTFPRLQFNKVSNGGALKVGNYFFYFKLADTDGNETDFFAESGLVSIFKGSGHHSSISTGERDNNSLKQVRFTLYDLDTSYTYVNVYYSRYSSEAGFNKALDCAKILSKYIINVNGVCRLTITGFEPTESIPTEALNLTYFLADNVNTQATCQNRLFLGNINKAKIDYEILSQISLRFCPVANQEDYDVNLTPKYSNQTKNKGYIDPVFIYNKTGYWNKELYRFGIVYILPNGDLTPVFDIRGIYNLKDGINCTNIPLFEDKTDSDGNKIIKNIKYDEETYKLIYDDAYNTDIIYENVKGVVRMDYPEDITKIYSFKFTTSDEVIQELKKHVKGFFFVRQHRIPTILAQGITIGIDKFSGLPTIPVDGSDNLISSISNQLTKDTHVTSDNLNETNYISEGFVSRYRFKFKKKKSAMWKQIGTAIGIAVAVVAAVAATVVTCGAGGAVFGSLAVALGAAASGTAAAVTTIGIGVGIATGIAVGGTAVVGVTMASISEAYYSAKRIGEAKIYNGWDTKIPDGYEIEELSNSRKLTHSFKDRLIIKSPKHNKTGAILCPEFDVNQAYYNSIFCGNKCYIESISSQSKKPVFSNTGRQFYLEPEYELNTIPVINNLEIVALTDNQKTAAIGETLYHARAGEAEEAWKYESIATDHLIDKKDEYNSVNTEHRKINSDIVRGSFGPYLAININNSFETAKIVNIYIPGYNPSNYEEYVSIRMNDASAFKAITHRYNLNDLDDYSPQSAFENTNINYEFPIYRGDCYICQYTHRLNRNFNDPAAPYNDKIIDENCWKNNYDPQDLIKNGDINLGDVNAVQLGMWITFPVRATRNLNVLTLDESNVAEMLMSGHARGHYPQVAMSVEGSYKIPESSVYNAGMETSLSEQYRFSVPDVPYIKQHYSTRILYSDIQINDAFKNGYRQFWATNFRDYPIDYGSITKILNWKGSIFCVFEHGIALIPVNERSVAGSGPGGNVYINTNNVLPQNPNMISDIYGSQWKDSIIATPRGIYGVDTIAKKIWKFDGNQLILISENILSDFLNKHISLGERELDVIIGIRNVKTHYNAFKSDIMFTFYDNKYDFEEEAWNLCYNELINKFTTFYSWMPSYSENIYNQYFSFDRDTSKAIAKLGISKYDSQFADGITLSNNIVSDSNKIIKHTFENREITCVVIGDLNISNRVLNKADNVKYIIKYEIVRDVWKNYSNFVILYRDSNSYYDEQNEDNTRIPVLVYKGVTSDFKKDLYYRAYYNSKEEVIVPIDPNNPEDLKKIPNYTDLKKIYTENGVRKPILNQQNEPFIWYLNIRANVTAEREDLSKTLAEAMVQSFNNKTKTDLGYWQSTIAITHEYNLQFFTTDFWKHGQSGIIDIMDPIKPTYWYGKQHPFEFEFVVNDNIQLHKIFDNLQIISNNSEPESFHYEITGDCYDFAEDKKNMFIRQEATKELYQYNGSDISFDRSYKTMEEKQGTKSTIFPLYYFRQDYTNQIQDKYHHINDLKNNSLLNTYYSDNKKDFSALAGGEIVYDKTLNDYKIWNHSKAVDIREKGLLRGNMVYKEDKWDVQINPLNFVQCNEDKWANNKVPINPVLFKVPEDVDFKNELTVPKEWGDRQVSENKWSKYNESKLKDKWVKIRIRYSGEKLTTILAINTLYSISYA